MNKKFAIFDFDGTLVDSMLFWENLGKEYLNQKGIKSDLDELFAQMETLSMEESAKLIINTFSLDSSPEKVIREMYELMENHYKQDISLKRNVVEYLEKLEQENVTMGVVSETSESIVSEYLKDNALVDYFAFILSGGDLGTSKREPLIYLEAARRFQAKPEEIAVYEDALYAIETACKAGFYCVAVKDVASVKRWPEIEKQAHETVDFM